MKKGIIIIGGITVALAIVLLYAAYSISKVNIASFELDVGEVGLNSATVNGILYLENPSLFNVKVKSLDYIVHFNGSDEMLGQGTVEPFKLNRRDVTQVDFTQEIIYASALELALAALQGESTQLIVEGDIKASMFWIIRFNTHFILNQPISS